MLRRILQTPPFIALFALLTTTVVLCIAMCFIPDEPAPSVQAMDDGTTVYFLKSLEASLLMPIALLAAPGSIALYMGIVGYDRTPRGWIPTTRLGKAVQLPMKVLFYFLVGCIAATSSK